MYDNHGHPHKPRESQTNQTFNTIFTDFASSILICEIISVCQPCDLQNLQAGWLFHKLRFPHLILLI